MSVLGWWTRPGRVSREVTEEIQAHIDERTDELVESGVPHGEARRRAHIELGSAARAIEDSRGVWVSRLIDQGTREARWVWRGLRARGGRAVLSVGLLAFALAANVMVFAMSDSLAFNRAPYPHAADLVQLQRARPGGWPNSWLSARALDEWRHQTDLFMSVDGYLTGTVFLLGGETAGQMPIVSVTSGLFDTLGVQPLLGRRFVLDDERRVDEQSVLIAESFAKRRFGSAAQSLNQVIETTAQPLRVVGVMPASFEFPDGRAQMWRAIDPAGPLTLGYGSTVSSVARLRPDVERNAAQAVVKRRGAAIDEAAALSDVAETSIAPLSIAQTPRDAKGVLSVLFGAAFCLLLTACVNVLNLELTGIVSRRRTLAVQSALGASRATLIRIAALEGVSLVSAATLVAWIVATVGLSAAGVALPAQIRFGSANPIDLDSRALIYMVAVAVLTWAIAALPAVVHASRLDLSRPLKADDRAMSPARLGAHVRGLVTVAQVSLAVLLVVVGGLYARTYQHLLTLPKGFDSTNLAAISISLPNRFYPSSVSIWGLADDVVARLRALPGVEDAVDGPAPPSTGTTPTLGARVGVDGQLGGGESVGFAITAMDPRYFAMLGVPLRSGRWPTSEDDQTAVAVGESFGRRYWPGGDAVGHTFQVFSAAGKPMSSHPDYRVVGVYADYRTANRAMVDPKILTAFTVRRPPTAAPRPRPAESRAKYDSGGSYGMVNVLVRLRSHDDAAVVLAAARAVDPRVMASFDFVDDIYADQQRPTLLITRIVGLFGVGAFLIAMAGVYGVMSFLVSGRTREIGIRMALGADRRRIGRSVMGSALRLVLIGAALGLAGAVAISRLIASQLFNVSPMDPATYVTVAVTTIATALLATWQPMRRAARVDPVKTLRAE